MLLQKTVNHVQPHDVDQEKRVVNGEQWGSSNSSYAEARSCLMFLYSSVAGGGEEMDTAQVIVAECRAESNIVV